MDIYNQKEVEWRHLITVPNYFNPELCDMGIVEYYKGKTLIDKDDLRVSIKSVGPTIMLPHGARIRFNEYNDWIIEVLLPARSSQEV